MLKVDYVSKTVNKMMYNDLTFHKKSIKNQLALLIIVKFFNLIVPNYGETSELICTVIQLTGFHKL